MSVKQMAMVWELDLDPNKKIVLLAYADHADDDGDNVYPSLSRIAHKTGYSVDQVRRISRDLVMSGLMELVRKGVGRGNPHRYRLTLSKGSTLQPFSPKKGSKTQGFNEQEKVASEPVKGGTAMPPEPSIEPSVMSTDSEKQDPPALHESQKLTNDFYNRLKGRYNITLEKEQYEFHLGHFRSMLKKYEPTDEEVLRVIAFMVDKYPAMPKIRATKAIQDVRLGRDTGEAWDGPAPWDKPPVEKRTEDTNYAHYEDFTSTTPEERKRILEAIRG